MDNLSESAFRDLFRAASLLHRIQTPAAASSRQNNNDEKKPNKRARNDNSNTKSVAPGKKPSSAAGGGPSGTGQASESSSASSAIPRAVLPTVAWNSFSSSSTGDPLSVSGTQMHDGDVTTLADALGLLLVRRAGCPQFFSQCLVASNVISRMSLSDHNFWIDSITRHLPMGVSISRTEQRAPVPCSLPGEALELFEILPLSDRSTVSLPPRSGTHPQCPPHVMFIPSAEVHAVPHIFSFLTRGQSDVLRECSVVGSVRCFAWNTTDIALNARMIQTSLSNLLELPLRSRLVVLPSLISHDINLDPPLNYEVIYRVFVGASSTPLAVFAALFGVSAEGDLDTHPGMIISSDFPCLLVRNSELLRGLPFDPRLMSANRALPANVVLTAICNPLLRQASFAQTLTILKQVVEEGSVAGEEVLRICRRVSSNSILLFTRASVVNAISGPLSRVLPGATATVLEALPTDWEPSRLTLLNHLHGLFDDHWHASVVRPFPHGAPGPVLPPTAPGPTLELLLQDELRRLDESISRCDPRLIALETKSLVHEAHLESLKSDLLSLDSLVQPLHLSATIQSLREDQYSARQAGREAWELASTVAADLNDLRLENDSLRVRCQQLEASHQALETKVNSLLDSILRHQPAHANAPSPSGTPLVGAGEVDEVLVEHAGRSAEGESEEELSPLRLPHRPVSNSIARLAGGLNVMVMFSPPPPAGPLPDIVGEVMAGSLPASPAGRHGGDPLLELPMISEAPGPVAASPDVGRGGDVLLEGTLVSDASSLSGLSLLPSSEMLHSSEAPPRPGPSLASLVAPVALDHAVPVGLVRVSLLDIMGSRGIAPVDLDLRGMVLSAGLSDCVNRQGVNLIRVTILLPAVHWGMTFLIPTTYVHAAGGGPTEQVDRLLMGAKVTCHRMVIDAPVVLPAPPAPAAVKWMGSHYPAWVTLATPSSYGDLLATDARHHYAVIGRSIYSLRASLAAPRHLLASLAWTALQALGDGLKALQTSALAAVNVLHRMVIQVGEYRLLLAPAVAGIVLRALARQPPALSDEDILSMPCTPQMGIELVFPHVYGTFNLLHAVAAGLANRDGTDGCREFLKAGKRNLKALVSERSKCLDRLPSPPARHADAALWGTFLRNVKTHDSKLPVEFSDHWLMSTIWSHAWLGHFWEYDDCNVHYLMGQVTIRDVLELHHGIQIAVLKGPVNSFSSSAASSSLVITSSPQAVSFVAPELPEDGLETIRHALLDKFGHLAPEHPTGRHSSDPLGIDYPARIFD